MDLDGDGIPDILSGCYSRMDKAMAGLFYVMHGKPDGTYIQQINYEDCTTGNIWTPGQAVNASIGKPTENGYCERLIRTLKEEEVYWNEYEGLEDGRERIGHFLDDVYTLKRIHSSLGYRTPAEFEAAYRRDQAGSQERSGDGGVRKPKR